MEQVHIQIQKMEVQILALPFSNFVTMSKSLRFSKFQLPNQWKRNAHNTLQIFMRIKTVHVKVGRFLEVIPVFLIYAV
jgi:hypothetical protein